MHKFALYIFAILLCTPLLAQEAEIDSTSRNRSEQQPDNTLLREPVQHSIYGAAVMKLAPTGPDATSSLFVGGELCWVLNKTYFLGLGFNGLSTVVDAPKIFPVEGLVLVNNFGGVIFGYVHQSRRMLHFEGQLLAGVGQAFYRDPEYRATYDQNDAYIVLEPSVSAVLNVTSGFRLAAGLSYKIATHVNLIGLENKDLSGLCLNLAFKVGRF